jgi:hypothetical protein
VRPGVLSRLATDRVEIRLQDGTPVLIRPIGIGDRELIRKGFDNLSEESRRRRFLVPTSLLTAEELDYLTHLDYWDHFAGGAIRADGSDEGIAVERRRPGRRHLNVPCLRPRGERTDGEAARRSGRYCRVRFSGAPVHGPVSSARLDAGHADGPYGQGSRHDGLSGGDTQRRMTPWRRGQRGGPTRITPNRRAIVTASSFE